MWRLHPPPAPPCQLPGRERGHKLGGKEAFRPSEAPSDKTTTTSSLKQHASQSKHFIGKALTLTFLRRTRREPRALLDAGRGEQRRVSSRQRGIPSPQPKDKAGKKSQSL
ncbi:hypothetical protein GWK47_020305 [Chionoecetes opilio]|uniref:Uncharacterized protein n=1 Tax=Chionoecetes opilio TaxID=41210 RepID=A0A8J4XPT0_CHIOP|nr:hypothetical protein GWK47_020305 [Chionoecetes opilio]